jgi:hypothetical protein
MTNILSGDTFSVIAHYAIIKTGDLPVQIVGVTILEKEK